MMRGRLRERFRARTRRSPWESIVGRGVPERLQQTDRRVLMGTSVGGHPLAPLLDSIVGVALWLRGADVRFLLCNAALPACEHVTIGIFQTPEQFMRRGPQARACGSCFGRGSTYFAPLPIPVNRYRDFTSAAEAAAVADAVNRLSTADCFAYELDGMRLGEQARSNTLRFFGNAALEAEDPHVALNVARRSLGAALLTARVASSAFERHQTECVVAHHGVYVPQGALGEAARRHGVRVVNWAAGGPAIARMLKARLPGF